MSSDILLKFAKKGFNLSPEAYKLILESDNPINLTSSLIVKLKSGDYNKDDYVSVSVDIVRDILDTDIKESKNNHPNPISDSANNDNNPDNSISKDSTNKSNSSSLSGKNNEETILKTDNQNETLTDNNQNNKSNQINNKPKDKNGLYDNQNEKKEFDASEIRYNPGTDTKPEKIEDIKNTKKHSIYKRNMEKTNVKYDFKILQDTSKKSYTSGEISNLISYFESRYEKESKILLQRPELKLAQKIEEIGKDQSDLALILMVNEVRTTKKGHKLIEFEDDTGQIPVLFSKDNAELISEAEKLVKDEVVGILATKMSGDK